MPPQPDEAIVNVRYLVDDVEEAIAFYTTHLGFEVITNQAPAFADVLLEDPSGNVVELFQPR
jgi:catechol 2,3-dioxygenase-like lactoylglutathione lyase family enzyme